MACLIAGDLIALIATANNINDNCGSKGQISTYQQILSSVFLVISVAC